MVLLGHTQPTGANPKAAETIRRHIANIVTNYPHPVTNAMSAGLNSQIQTIKRMACDFRNNRELQHGDRLPLRRSRFVPMLNPEAPVLLTSDFS